MSSFPSLLFGAMAGALDFGAHRVVIAWAVRAFPGLSSHRSALLRTAGVLAIGPYAARQALFRARSLFTELVFAGVYVELMVVLLAAVPLLVLLLASRARGKRADGGTSEAILESPSPTEAAPAEPPAVSRRVAVERIGGGAILGATSALFGWGMTVGRHDYQIREVAVRIPGLAKALDGYVIAQISDIHAGLFVRARELRDAGDLMRRVKPDLVVATGDLVDIDASHAPELARALADFRARDGVFAILGNHDYYAGARAVADAVRGAGVALLINDARMIRGAEGGFALVGVDDAWSRPYGGPGPKLDVATASLPTSAPRVLLAHQPAEFHRYAGKVALQLSGHTHGGQIEPGNHFLRGYVAGRYERDGSTLYVNSGFGVAGPPARLGVPPEVTKIVLVSA
jgi:predicted MPP superfamily phosphohydrolase